MRRGDRYYFRLRIPSDLLTFFGERRELKKSLRTAKHITARGLVRVELYRAEQLFSRIRGGFMTNEEIRRLVSAYFERSLAEAEDARADGVGVFEDFDEDGEHGVSSLDLLDLHLSDLVESLARGELERMAHLADHILEEAGVTLDRNSHDYRKLCREALKGAVAATRVELEHMKGNYQQAPVEAGGHGGGTSPASAPVETGEPLSRLIAEYSHECSSGGRWRGRTRKEAEGCLSLLVRLVGDRDIRTLTRKDFIGFRDALKRWPGNATKAKKYKGLTAQEVLALAEESAASPLSPTTINKYLVFTGALMRWAVVNGHTTTNFAEGLSLSKRNVREGDEREAYDAEDLQRLVRSPLGKFRETRPERFFIPWVGLFSGMRLAEIAQLHLADVREVDGVHVFDVNSAGDKALKNVSSRRIVPVHPALLDLGLMGYVEKIRGQGETRLWPNLKRTQTGYGQDFGRWYQRWNRVHVTENPLRTFHSLRHSFSTALKRQHVPVAVIAELTGHSHGSIDLDRYGKGFPVGVLLEALGKLEYGIEEELRRLPRLG